MGRRGSSWGIEFDYGMGDIYLKEGGWFSLFLNLVRFIILNNHLTSHIIQWPQLIFFKHFLSVRLC